MKSFLNTFFFHLILSTLVFSQITDSTDIKTEETLNEILDESFEESDNSDLYNSIEELLLNPIDLNSADIFELTKIPFVTTEIAKIIISYRDKFGPFVLVQELYSMKEIDKSITDKIIPFVKVENNFDSLNQFQENELSEYQPPLLSNLKILLRSRFGNDLQTREGFRDGTYVGSKLRAYNRILLKYSNNIQAGILFEKDAGEKDFNDFNSYHLSIRDFDLLNQLIIGDYIVEFGQGLMLWSPYSFSKGSDAIFPVKRRGKILKPYTSSTEYNFMRGIAASLSLDNFLITIFYSAKSVDANIDSVSNKIISTPETGLHTTLNELSRKNLAKEKLFGGRIAYKYKSFLEFGVSTYFSEFSHDFLQTSVYDLAGREFNYYSFDYNLYYSVFNFFGEFVYNKTSVASINGVILSPANNFIVSASLRNYPKNFVNLHGFGFGEQSGKTQNEFGIYLGVKYRSNFGIINLYYDQFRFPFSTFENPVPSSGKEIYLSYSKNVFNNSILNLRFKSETKDVTEDFNSVKTTVERIRNSFRAELVYEISKNLRMKSRMELNTYGIEKIDLKEKGILIFQDVRYNISKNLLIQGRIILFETDSFKSAVYEFENDLAGILSNLAMYDEGMRWYLLVKYKILKNLTLSAKYSETYKPGLRTLSSGNNIIYNNKDNRISFQIDLNY